MRCFLCLKDKFKGRKQPKSPPTTGSALVSSPTSNNGGSRSEGSGAAKQQSKSSGSVSSQRSIPELYEERAHNLRVFELRELRNATNDFSRLLKIGEGGFGSVYKGWIKPPDGKGDNIVVAVKKLNPNSLQVLMSPNSCFDLQQIATKDKVELQLMKIGCYSTIIHTALISLSAKR